MRCSDQHNGRLTALALALLLALPAWSQRTEPALEFVVERSDTLIGLSRELLVSPEAWPEVARVNRLRDPDLLQPGQTLLIPLRLLRSNAVAGRLVSVNGDVRIGGQAAAVGSSIDEGQAVETGAGSSAVIELADASRVKLAPSSLAEIAASRRYTGPGRAGSTAGTVPSWFSGALRVLRGSVEVFATKVLRAKPLEVTTPTAVVGVRGTQYRVNFDDTANRRTNSEVLVGAVRIDAADASSGADIPAGFGAALEQGSSGPPVVTRLTPAPDLSGIAPRFERPLVRFNVGGEALPLRIQVSPDASFDKIVHDERYAADAEVRIPNLADATWILRARRIDRQGIEGFDAVRPFVLKARPEPPASNQPRRRAKQTVGAVEFAWAENLEAGSYRLQIARDAEFKDLVLERDSIEARSLSLDFDREGQFHWRLASTRPDGDRGPFGDPQTFELRPMPAAPKGGLAEDGKALVLAWGGRDIDRHQVELARDPAFNDIVARAELATPEWVLPKPERPGEYYFRYRSVEPDGFVSPYSSTLKIEVPRDWSFLWLLAPLLFLL